MTQDIFRSTNNEQNGQKSLPSWKLLFFEKFIFVRDDLDILDLIRIKEEGGISEVLHIHAILAGFEARRVPEL